MTAEPKKKTRKRRGMTPTDRAFVLQRYEESKQKRRSSQDAVNELAEILGKSERQIYRIIESARRERLPLQGGPLWLAHQRRLCRAVKTLAHLLPTPYAPTTPLPGHFDWDWDLRGGFSVRDTNGGLVLWEFRLDDEILKELLEDHLDAVEGWKERFESYRKAGGSLSALCSQFYTNLRADSGKPRTRSRRGLVWDGFVGSVYFESLSRAEGGGGSGASYRLEVVGAAGRLTVWLRYGGWALAKPKHQKELAAACKELTRSEVGLEDLAPVLGPGHQAVTEVEGYRELHQEKIKHYAESKEAIIIVELVGRVRGLGKECQRQLKLLVERGSLPGRCDGCP